MTPLVGTSRGRQVVGRGAGGDRTVYLDAVAEEIVLRHLETAYRSGLRFRLLSEELGARDFGGGDLVLVDPVDGSLNAKYGVPYFAVTLAVSAGEWLQDVGFAMVASLASDDEFVAELGQGAYHNGSRIQPAAAGDGHLGVVQIEAGNRLDAVEQVAPLVKEAERMRILGSAALNLCHTATGAIAVHVAPRPVRAFDLAGPLLVLREAGGRATTIDGAPLDRVSIDLATHTTVLASASVAIHAHALRLLAGSH